MVLGEFDFKWNILSRWKVFLWGQHSNTLIFLKKETGGIKRKKREGGEGYKQIFRNNEILSQDAWMGNWKC